MARAIWLGIAGSVVLAATLGWAGVTEASVRPGVAVLARVPPHTGPVVDLARVLTPSGVASIRASIERGTADGGVVLNVLVIDRMQDWDAVATDVEAFTQAVFDAWGIGDATTNNGALLLVAVGDHQARIELGAGFDGERNGAMRTVMSEVLIPAFRRGDFADGIVRGADRIVEVLTSPVPTRAPSSSSARSTAAASAPASVPLGGSSKGSSGGAGAAVVGLLMLGGAAAAVVGGARFVVRRRRSCPNCGATCALLSEADDDAFLDDGQRMEEFLRSVDHRAWKCPSCSHVRLHARRRLFSHVKRCASCGYRTATSVSTTIDAATYASAGRALVVTTCQRSTCGHRTETSVTLPQLQHTSTSSSGSSHSFSSSSHSSGGGHSGGGGASGSW